MLSFCFTFTFLSISVVYINDFQEILMNYVRNERKMDSKELVESLESFGIFADQIYR